MALISYLVLLYFLIPTNSLLKIRFSYHVRLIPTTLMPDARYDKVMSAFGGIGYHVTTPTELEKALHESLTTHSDKPVLINVMVSPQAQRKKQVRISMGWKEGGGGSTLDSCLPFPDSVWEIHPDPVTIQ